MKRSILFTVPFMAVLFTVSVSLIYADDPEKPEKNKIQDAKETPGIHSLIEALGAERFDEREKAYEALKKKREEARPHLIKALQSEDPEIRWRASRLLSHLDSMKVELEDDGSAVDHDIFSLERRIKELRRMMPWPGKGFGRSLDDMPDVDLFSGRIEDLMDDLFKDSFPRFRFRLLDDEPFNGIMDRFEQLKDEDGVMRMEINGCKAKCHMERSDENGRESCTMEICEDGSVKASVSRTDENGKSVEHIYESDSIDEFKKDHPDIVEKFGLDGFTFGFNVPRSRLGRLLDEGSKGFDERSLQAFIAPERIEKRKMLGIYIDPNGPDTVLRNQLDLEPGQGIIIQKVLPGSFASEIGLKTYDIILAVNGKSVGSADQIGAALSSVESGDEVMVTIIRNGEKKLIKGNYSYAEKKQV